MVTRTEWYQRVNAAWPADVPELTGPEAIRAARKLYRFVKRRTYTGTVKLTSGRRYSGWSNHALVVNPNGPHYPGWKGLVHELSHAFDPNSKHNGAHARLELRMIKEVVKRGWLAGSLKTPEKPEKPEPDLKLIRHKRILDRIEVWKTKQKRAERALKKLTRQARYYERSLKV